eukprot:PhF_6_TR37220/c2_g2_i10/m.54897
MFSRSNALRRNAMYSFMNLRNYTLGRPSTSCSNVVFESYTSLDNVDPLPLSKIHVGRTKLCFVSNYTPTVWITFQIILIWTSVSSWVVMVPNLVILPARLWDFVKIQDGH